ncbi:MAG: hypothetical protein ACRDI2_15180 [Chloroflexota bacterium]
MMKDATLLTLRLVTGGLLAGHGTQKLFGWFGGHGLEGIGGIAYALSSREAPPAASDEGGDEASGRAETEQEEWEAEPEEEMAPAAAA